MKNSFSRASELPGGFALIVTLSLMVLLAILAVGLLGLSTVTLRSAGHGSARSQARANAQLALMIAIGELQKHAGPDTRVTASSGIVVEDSPPLLGVWKSWEGTDHETTGPFAGRPVTPDYHSKTQAAANGGRFLTWLVSGAPTGGDASSPGDLATSIPAANSIPLIASGTLGGSAEGAVHVVPQPLGASGKMAWWVSGENQKARLPAPYKPKNANSVAGWSDIARSHAVPDPEPFGLENLLTDASPAAKAITLGSVDFIAKAGASPAPRESFHDLSVSSVGLLTNTATGGWRKDLSLLTENWDALPDGMPFFRIDPNSTTYVHKPSLSDPRAAQSIFYPWSDYAGVITDSPIHQVSAVTSWRNLVEFATAYKRITPSAGGSGTIPFMRSHFFPITTDSVYDYLHAIRTVPSVARVQWVFSHRTTLVEGDPSPKNDTYRLQLLITPVVTLWNPYNVSVNVPASGMKLNLVKSPPCVLHYHHRDGTPSAAGRKLITGTSFPGQDSLVANYPDVFWNFQQLEYRITGGFTLLPGETRVFSAGSVVTTSAVSMVPGYNPNGGHFRTIDFIGESHKKEDKIKLFVKFDNLINLGAPGCGIWLEMENLLTGGNRRWHERYMLAVTQETALKYWPEIQANALPTPEAQEIEGTTWHPFFSTVFGARVASDTNLATKGLLQASPLVSYTNMVLNAYNPSANHPANGAFDYSFIPHHLGGDDKTPNANPLNNRGYIISGYQAGTGLSRAIINDFPLRPITSIAELQNWNLRANNPYPPFQLNVIGNSDASPLVAPQMAHIPHTGAIFQHDDPYCANHLLFDDWFFSSIAPEPAAFGSAIAADLPTLYTGFLKGERPLPNRAYRRIAEDMNLSDAEITARVGAALAPDGWQRVASRLDVEGMFNVNSTSVKAWRALLGHARDQKMPYHTEGGIDLSADTDHAHSRSSVAGDVKAGEQGMSGGFPESSEITGYRVFDDGLLDILAEKTVEQIRLRGPFLSLSEFVNRQLSDDKDLALSGAIQTALNKMSGQAGANDPLKVLKSPDLSQDTGDPADPKLVGADYLFPEAAVGKSTYGLPGWIRQADVLRPLAPILSARDDTFTIRAYGDARDKAGNILAKAWCEATVRRTRDFVDPADAPEITTAPTRPANLAFGRRFSIVSFRWLSPVEV